MSYSKTIKGVEPNFYQISKVYVNESTVEVVTSRNQYSSNLGRYKKINKDLYVDTKTGECKEYRHNNSVKSKSSFNKTFSRLRRLVNCNFSSTNKALHVVLTYAKYLADPKQLHCDFQSFWLRFKKIYPNYAYIWIAEPHGNGSWHIHLLLKLKDESPGVFIPAKIMQDLWKCGSVHVNFIPHTNNFGGYFTSQIDDDLRKLYPANLRIYYYSREIVFPKPIRMSRAELNLFVTEHQLCRTKFNTIGIYDDTLYGTRELNRITYEIFEK